MLHLVGAIAVIRRVADAHRAGSRYRFVESRKSRTVVKRGPVLACKSAAGRARRAYTWRADGNADAETGIGYPGGYRSAYSLLNGPRGHSAERGQRRHAVDSRGRYQHARTLARYNFSRYLRELAERAMRALINGSITYRWQNVVIFRAPGFSRR